jgi:hypothetical protein
MWVEKSGSLSLWNTVDSDETAQPRVGFGGAARMFVHYRREKA